MQIQKEKILDINFDSFLAITGMKKIINIFKTDLREEIINQADFLIKTQNYEAYTKMLKQGYYPTKHQQEKIENFIDDILSKSPMSLSNNASDLYVNLEQLLQNGLTLSYQNVARFLRNDYKEISVDTDLGGLLHNESVFSNKDYIIKGIDTLHPYTDDNYLQFPCLTKQFRHIIQQPDFSTYLFKQFNQSLITKFPKLHQFAVRNGKVIHYEAPEKERTAYHTLLRYEQVLTHAPQLLFKNVDFKGVALIIEKLHYTNISHKHTSILNNIVNNLYNKDLNNLFEDTKTNFSSNLAQNIALESIINEKHNMNDLPQTALTLINDIESVYIKIKDNNYSDIDKLTQLNILLEKRLPEVLSKYLKVDPEYRQTLKSSQGKNAEDLMIDSLVNIKQSFINVFKNINQDNVNSLSATNRYTKTMKM